MTLDQVLAETRAEAAVLRHNGHAAQAATMERLADQVQTAALDYLTWLTDDQARSRSGRTIAWMRAQFPRWEAQGLARRDGRRRLYRAIIVPVRVNLDLVRADARRAALEGAA